MILAGIALLAKGLGFLRDVILAAQFGATRETDAFFLVFTFWFQFGLLLMFAMSKVIVPRYIASERPGKLVGSALFAVVVVLGTVTLAGGVWVEPLARGLAPSFDEAALGLMVHLLRIALPTLVLCGIAGVYLAVARARGHFFVGDLGLLAVNGGVIIGLVVFGESLGIASAAWGLTGGIMATALVLVGYGLRHRIPIQPTAMSLTEGIRILAPAVAILSFGGAGGHAMTLVNRFFFGLLPSGQLTCFGYAERALMLPLTVVMYALMTTLLPSLAERFRAGEGEEAEILALRALRVLLFGLVPIVVFMAVASEPIVRLLFGRGAFGEDDIALTALLIALLVPAAILAVARSVLAELFYAARDVKTPVIAAVIGVAVCACVFPFVWKPFGVVGLAAARAGADAIALAWIVVAARRRLAIRFSGLGIFTARLGTAAGVAGAVAVSLPSMSSLTLQIVLGWIVFTGTYVVLAKAVRLRELDVLFRLLRSRSFA
jgi:putative peptidoglycan lipid II flippase